MIVEVRRRASLMFATRRVLRVISIAYNWFALDVECVASSPLPPATLAPTSASPSRRVDHTLVWMDAPCTHVGRPGTADNGADEGSWPAGYEALRALSYDFFPTHRAPRRSLSLDGGKTICAVNPEQ